MLGQVGGFCETLGAHGTDIWTYSSVDFLMLRQAAGQCECFPTVGAGEGPLSQVFTLMTLQGEGFIEGLTTVRAGERLVVGVHVPLMLPQVRGADEILAASVTDVGLLTSVCANMFAVV